MPTQLWRPITGSGLERCELEPTAAGYQLTGTTLLTIDNDPYEIRYSIMTDSTWAITTVGAHVSGPESDRRLALASDGAGSWSVTDEPIIELFGATDVSLSWTPAGHTAAIRRLDLAEGSFAETVAVSIGFPRHEIERRQHRYERIALRRYRFWSGDFSTDLEVDEHALIVTYPGRWASVLSR